MAFRVDHVMRGPQQRWTFLVKGIHGAGVYGVLFTQPDGRELHLASSYQHPKSVLLAPDFVIHTDRAHEAIEALERVLVEMGWGPCLPRHSGIRH